MEFRVFSIYEMIAVTRLHSVCMSYFLVVLTLLPGWFHLESEKISTCPSFNVINQPAASCAGPEDIAEGKST